MPQAYLYTVNQVIPGDSMGGEADTSIEALLDPVLYPLSYGLPVKVVAGKIEQMQVGDTVPAAFPFGWIVRPYPSHGGGPTNISNDPLATSTPPTSGKVTIMLRGFIGAKLFGPVAAAFGMPVWIRTSATSGIKLFGGVQASADTATCTQITNNTFFMGPADASGNVIIGVNI